MRFIGIAIAAAVSIGCINLFVFMLLKGCCSSPREFKALAVQWVKLQFALYGLLIAGWVVWHGLILALGEAAQSESVRIALALAVSIPGVVMLLYVRTWVKSVGQMASKDDVTNSGEG
ncbi:MAG: hypothetical protein GDYSWBUE_000288 [Candidatus Fervidibacterota bacterium]